MAYRISGTTFPRNALQSLFLPTKQIAQGSNFCEVVVTNGKCLIVSPLSVSLSVLAIPSGSELVTAKGPDGARE